MSDHDPGSEDSAIGAHSSDPLPDGRGSPPDTPPLSERTPAEPTPAHTPSCDSGPARRGSPPEPPPDREVSLGTSSRRMAVLALLGLLLGGVGGGAAFLIVRAVGLISNLALLHRVGFDLPDLRHYHPTVVLIPIAVGGALLVVALARWSPIIKGHGIPESLEAILFRESRIAPRAAVAKPTSAAIVMGTGGPFGAEGPVIVTGASLGSILGQLLPVSTAERRILLATGAAAGMAGVFSTPVAAVVLAFELLLFERSLRALVPLTIATAVAAALHDVLISPHPLFPLAHTLTVPASQLPLFAILGLAAGALAVVLNRGLFGVENVFRRLPIPKWSHPIVGALGYSLIGLAVPGSLSVGYWAITDAVNDRFLLAGAAALFVAKMCSWWIGLGSNTSGGTLAPMFLVGASMGEMVGIGFAHAFPGAHIEPGAFALVAMGVTFGVGARALLTGVVFAAEVTGGFDLLLPLLLATAVAEIVAEAGLRERVMTDKLFRRGFRVDFDAQTDPLRMRIAGMVMDPVDAAPSTPVVAETSSGSGPTSIAPVASVAPGTVAETTSGSGPTSIAPVASVASGTAAKSTPVVASAVSLEPTAVSSPDGCPQTSTAGAPQASSSPGATPAALASSAPGTPAALASSAPGTPAALASSAPGTPAALASATPGAAAGSEPHVERWAFLADALPFLLEAGCSRVAVTDRGEVVGYVTRDHIDAELRRRVAEETLQAPTLGPRALRRRRSTGTPAS